MVQDAPTKVQLENLERVLSGIASEHGFALYSPFADRHGAAQCRFLRADGDTVQVIGVGCDVRDELAGLICDFSAGVSAARISRSRTVANISLDPHHVSRNLLRKCFLVAVKEVEILYAALRNEGGEKGELPMKPAASIANGELRADAPDARQYADAAA